MRGGLAVTAPDDERDRLRDLDDTSSVPETDRPRRQPTPGTPADRPGGVGEVPTHRPASEAMPGTSEEAAPVQGVFVPVGDDPAT